MKMLCFGIGASMLLTAMALLSACNADRFQQNTSGKATAGSNVAPDLPAAFAFMQPQAIYTDLTELRHYNAYHAFRAMSNTSSGGSGDAEETSAVTETPSCFGNQ